MILWFHLHKLCITYSHAKFQNCHTHRLRSHQQKRQKIFDETLIISYMNRMLDYKEQNHKVYDLVYVQLHLWHLGMSQRVNIWNLNSHVFKDFVESKKRQQIAYLKTIRKVYLKKIFHTKKSVGMKQKQCDMRCIREIKYFCCTVRLQMCSTQISLLGCVFAKV